MTPEQAKELAEAIKHDAAVEVALDAYASAVKAWGVTDHTPRRIMETETAMLAAVIYAAREDAP